MNKIIEKIFKDSKKNKKIVGIRKYNEGDEFWCGYIIDYDQENVLIQHYTKFGKPDGIVVERIDNIESVDTDDDYSKSFQYLVKNSSKIEKQTTFVLELDNSENWKYNLLKQLYSKAELVTIEINDGILVGGLISAIDSEFLLLQCIGKLGENEGSTIYRLMDITSIHYDRMEERKRKLLYDWKNKACR